MNKQYIHQLLNDLKNKAGKTAAKLQAEVDATPPHSDKLWGEIRFGILELLEELEERIQYILEAG